MCVAPYCIELRGGRFDGFRQGAEQMPAETRLEIPTDPSGWPTSPRSSSRLAVYERREVAFACLHGIPTMVLKYDYVRTKTVPTGRSTAV